MARGRGAAAGPDFRRNATADWLGPLEDGLHSAGRPDIATLILAVLRGLLRDRDATGDTTRTDRAVHDFLSTLRFLSTLKDLSPTDGSAVCDASSSTTRTDTASDKQSGLAHRHRCRAHQTAGSGERRRRGGRWLR